MIDRDWMASAATGGDESLTVDLRIQQAMQASLGIGRAHSTGAGFPDPIACLGRFQTGFHGGVTRSLGVHRLHLAPAVKLWATRGGGQSKLIARARVWAGSTG